MDQKNHKYHANVNVNLTVKNEIQIKFGKTVNVFVNVKIQEKCVKKRLYFKSC